MKLSRSWISAIAGAAAVLVVSGCSTATASDESESARQAASFPELYTQTIAWGECGDDFDLSDALAARLADTGASADT